MFKLPDNFHFDKRRTAWLAFCFASFVFWFESYKFGINYSEYFVRLSNSADVYSALISAAYLAGALVLFYFFVRSAFAASGILKIFYFLPFFAAGVFEYGYQKALGRFSDMKDVEIILATTAEQKTDSMFLYFSFWAFFPAVVFLVCLCLVRVKEPRNWRATLRTFAAGIVFFASLTVVGGLFTEKKFPTVSLNAFCRTSVDFLIWGPIYNGQLKTNVMGRNWERQPVKKPALAADYRPANNIVLVIDESVRGDHLSLNGYERQTTPLLDRLHAEGILHNWGIAVSASTASQFSYTALVTGLMPDDFPDKTEGKVRTRPLVFQYAKAMNYKTFFFDGQMKDYWGGINEDRKFIDQWTGVTGFDDADSPKHDIDRRIAAEVKKIVTASSGNFIVVFKRGSHIPYQANFPPERQEFKPSYTTTDTYSIPSAEQLPEVVNSYDNSIRYNLTLFFENLLDDYANIPNQTVILYTSDHGQSLFAGGKSSHGGKTLVEANVPLFIIGKLETAADTSYRASHHNILPTLLDLMNYPEALRGREKSVSLLKATAKDSRPRFFNPDLDEKVPFD